MRTPKAMASNRKRGGVVAKKPLYLLDGNAREVSARGESLHIAQADRLSRSLPLMRVQRVICGREVRWEGNALCACLVHGVPVTWVDRDGQAAGIAMPRQMVTGPTHQALLLYVQHPEWSGRYQNWLRSRRMEVLVHWAKHFGSRGPVSRRVFNDLKRQYVYQNRLPGHCVPEARAWCASLVAHRLLLEGIHIQYWAFDGESLDLANDLAGLVWAELTLHCGTLADQVKAGPAALVFFENWAQRNRNRFRILLGDLRRHLRTGNMSWH